MRTFLVCVFLVLDLYASNIESTEDVNKLNAATINTLLIFTSQDGLSSGLYHFTNTAVDVDMQVYHLPFTYHFRSSEKLNYFLVGNVGYSRTYLTGKIQETPSNSVLNYLNHIQTYTAGLGGGVRYKFEEDLSLCGGIELIYSRAGASVKQPDGDVGNVIEDFFNSNYSDNLSYKVFVLGEYRPRFKGYKPYLTFGYKLYETKSSFAFEDVLSFSSQSSITTLSAGVETPQLFEYEQNYLSLEVYANTNYLTGIVSEVTNVSSYSSLGSVAYWNTPSEPWWASRFFLELSGVKGNGLNGYNIGLGFSIDLD